jgi:peptidoglycan/xylan/chitin deacetylase (PgdA/CDA1 family)
MIPSVLFFHQVVRQARPEHYLLSQANTLAHFRATMIAVKQRWNPLSMEEFVWIHQKRKPWPRRAVVITFDDGFKNNLWAAEVLRELDMNATFFIISGVVGTRFHPWYVRFAEVISKRTRPAWSCSWGAVDFQNEFSRRRWLRHTKDHLLALRPVQRDAALAELADAVGADGCVAADPDLEFLSADDLGRLRDMGMTLGAHSRSHDDLTTFEPGELQSEIVDSADELAQAAGAPIRYFSYPDGRHNPQVVDVVRRRFDAAFTNVVGYSGADLWRFPRRAGDDGADVRRILSPWFPARRKIIERAKRILRF